MHRAACGQTIAVPTLQWPRSTGRRVSFRLFTENQRLQLSHSDDYMAVYTNHVRLHHELFADYRLAHIETEIADLYAEYRTGGISVHCGLAH